MPPPSPFKRELTLNQTLPYLGDIVGGHDKLRAICVFALFPQRLCRSEANHQRQEISGWLRYASLFMRNSGAAASALRLRPRISGGETEVRREGTACDSETEAATLMALCCVKLGGTGERCGGVITAAPFAHNRSLIVFFVRARLKTRFLGRRRFLVSLL